MPYLMASYSPKGSRSPIVNPEGQIATGVMVASASRDNIPVPSFNPSYSSSAQTAMVGNTPSHTLQAPTPFANAAPAAQPQQGYEQFMVLPEFGPFVQQRPDSNYLRLPSAKYAAAYSADNDTTSKTEAVFQQVLTGDRGELTEQSILSFVKKKQARQ
jgi:rare lipoprotein A